MANYEKEQGRGAAEKYRDEYEWMLAYSLSWQECAQQSQRDTSLSAETKHDLVDEYSANAQHCASEAERTYGTFLRAFHQEEPSTYVPWLCTELLLIRDGEPRWISDFEATFQCHYAVQFLARVLRDTNNEDAIDSENAIDSLKRFHVEQDCGQSQMLLAMLLWQLGKQDLAKQRFAEGAAYIQVHYPEQLKELRVFEAQQMLGLSDRDRMELTDAYRDSVEQEGPQQVE